MLNEFLAIELKVFFISLCLFGRSLWNILEHFCVFQYLQEISKFTASDSFREHNPGVLAEDYHRMVQSVVDVFTKFNGIKVPDYEQLCHDLTDSYLLAIVKFLARRESYNTINTEIMALKVIIIFQIFHANFSRVFLLSNICSIKKL